VVGFFFVVFFCLLVVFFFGVLVCVVGCFFFLFVFELLASPLFFIFGFLCFCDLFFMAPEKAESCSPLRSFSPRQLSMFLWRRVRDDVSSPSLFGPQVVVIFSEKSFSCASQPGVPFSGGQVAGFRECS